MLPKENPVLIRANGVYLKGSALQSLYPATINVPPPVPPNTPEKKSESDTRITFTTIKDEKPK
jgi:hypothetical protein